MKQFILIIATLLLISSIPVYAQGENPNETKSSKSLNTSQLFKELDDIKVPAEFNWEQYQVSSFPIPVENFSLTRPIPASIPESGVGIKPVKEFNLREKMVLYGFSSESDNFLGLTFLASTQYLKYFINRGQEPASLMELSGLRDLISEAGRQPIDKFNTEVAAGNPMPSIVGVVSPINNRVPKLHLSKFSAGDMFFSRVAPEDFINWIGSTTPENKMLTIVGNFKSNTGFMPFSFLTEKPIFDKDTVVFYARAYGYDRVIAEVMLVHTEKWGAVK